MELLRDLDKDTVDFRPNFDDTLQEPVVLPTVFPNMLCNGADGIAVGRPGDLPFALIRDHVDEVVTVDEDAISAALVRLAERNKLVCEPAGAVAVAALLDGVVPVDGPVVPATIFDNGAMRSEVLAEGLKALFETSGTRIGRVSLAIPDNLAKISLRPNRRSSSRACSAMLVIASPGPAPTNTW